MGFRATGHGPPIGFDFFWRLVYNYNRIVIVSWSEVGISNSTGFANSIRRAHFWNRPERSSSDSSDAIAFPDENHHRMRMRCFISTTREETREIEVPR
jgi:hypothetical protein